MRHSKISTCTHTLAVYPFTTASSAHKMLMLRLTHTFFSHIIVRAPRKWDRKSERNALGTFVKCEIHTTLWAKTGWIRAHDQDWETRNELIYIDGEFLFDMRSLYFTIKLSTHRWDKRKTQREYRIVFTHENQMFVDARANQQRKRHRKNDHGNEKLHKFTYNYFVLKMTSGQFILNACNFKIKHAFLDFFSWNVLFFALSLHSFCLCVCFSFPLIFISYLHLSPL